MAVEKVFKDDLTGEPVPRQDVLIFRVGTLSDRPEDCERLDIGPASLDRPIRELATLFRERRNSDGYDTAPA